MSDSVLSLNGVLYVPMVDYQKQSEKVKQLESRMRLVQRILERIRAWEMPSTGRVWEDGSPMSYSACFGTNGERNVIIESADTALELSRFHEGG